MRSKTSGGQFVAQFQDQALGGLEAEAGDADQGLGVLGGDGAGERVGVHRREDGQGDLGADPRHAEEQFKDLLVAGAGEAEQGDLLGADVGVDVQKRRLALRRQGVERGDGDGDLVADAADI